MKKSAQAAESGRIDLPVDFEYVRVELRGASPYLSHARTARKFAEIAESRSGGAKKKRPPVTAELIRERFVDALYWLTPRPAKPTDQQIRRATYGIPREAFKQSMLTGCSHIGGVRRGEASAAIFIAGEYIPIKSQAGPRMHQAFTKVGSGLNKVLDLRYRAVFEEWSVTLFIQYNASLVTRDRLVHLIEHAGFGIGVGDHRVEKAGDCGRYGIHGAVVNISEAAFRKQATALAKLRAH